MLFGARTIWDESSAAKHVRGALARTLQSWIKRVRRDAHADAADYCRNPDGNSRFHTSNAAPIWHCTYKQGLGSPIRRLCFPGADRHCLTDRPCGKWPED
eukprot:gene12938-biopygen6049